MTLETIIKSDLGRQFEKIVRSSRRKPAEVLAELMSEYIESEVDGKLFDSIQQADPTDYTEDDTVDIVRAARRARQK